MKDDAIVNEENKSINDQCQHCKYQSENLAEFFKHPEQNCPQYLKMLNDAKAAVNSDQAHFKVAVNYNRPEQSHEKEPNSEQIKLQELINSKEQDKSTDKESGLVDQSISRSNMITEYDSSTTRTPEDSSSDNKKCYCTKCDFFSYNSNDLLSHLSEFHSGRQIDDRSYTLQLHCPSCPFKTKDHRRLELHQGFCSNKPDESEKVVEAHQCPHCSFKSKFGGKLSTHIANKHDNFQNSEENQSVIDKNTTESNTTVINLSEKSSKSCLVDDTQSVINQLDTNEMNEENKELMKKVDQILPSDEKLESLESSKTLIPHELTEKSSKVLSCIICNFRANSSIKIARHYNQFHIKKSEQSDVHFPGITKEGQVQVVNNKECKTKLELSKANIKNELSINYDHADINEISENESNVIDSNITDTKAEIHNETQDSYVIDSNTTDIKAEIHKETQDSYSALSTTAESINDGMKDTNQQEIEIPQTIKKMDSYTSYNQSTEGLLVKSSLESNYLQIDVVDEKLSEIEVNFSLVTKSSEQEDSSQMQSYTPNNDNIKDNINIMGNIQQPEVLEANIQEPEINNLQISAKTVLNEPIITKAVLDEPKLESNIHKEKPDSSQKAETSSKTKHTSNMIPKKRRSKAEISLKQPKKAKFTKQGNEKNVKSGIEIKTTQSATKSYESAEQLKVIKATKEFETTPSTNPKYPTKDKDSTENFPLSLESLTEKLPVSREIDAKLMLSNNKFPIKSKELTTNMHKTEKSSFINKSSKEMMIIPYYSDRISATKSIESIYIGQQKSGPITKLFPVNMKVANKLQTKPFFKPKKLNLIKELILSPQSSGKAAEELQKDCFEEKSRPITKQFPVNMKAADKLQTNPVFKSKKLNQIKEVIPSLQSSGKAGEELQKDCFKEKSRLITEQFPVNMKVANNMKEANSENMIIDEISLKIPDNIPEERATKRKGKIETNLGKRPKPFESEPMETNSVVKDQVTAFPTRKHYAVETKEHQNKDKTKEPAIKLTFRRVVEQVPPKKGRNNRKKMYSRSRKRTISSKIKDFHSCFHCGKFKSKSLKRLQNHLALRHLITQRTKSSCSISKQRIQKHQEEKHKKEKPHVEKTQAEKRQAEKHQAEKHKKEKHQEEKQEEKRQEKKHQVEKHEEKCEKEKHWEEKQQEEKQQEVSHPSKDVTKNQKKIENENKELLHCKFCTYKISSKKRFDTHYLNKHMRRLVKLSQSGNENDKLLLQCQNCDYKITSPKRLQTHRTKKHAQVEVSSNPNLSEPNQDALKKKSIGKIYCKSCPYKTTQLKAFNNHMQKKHKEQPNEDPSTHSKIPVQDMKTIKKEPENKNDLLHCTECLYKTSSPNRLKYHGVSKHNKVTSAGNTDVIAEVQTVNQEKREEIIQDKLQCTESNYKTPSAKGLNNNEMTKQGKATTGDSDLAKQNLTAEFNTINLDNKKDKEKILKDELQCSECPFKTLTSLHLKIHVIKNHTNSIIVQTQDLKLNLKTQGQEKGKEVKTKIRWQCPSCNFKTPYPKRLKLHEYEIHSTLTPERSPGAGSEKLVPNSLKPVQELQNKTASPGQFQNEKK